MPQGFLRVATCCTCFEAVFNDELLLVPERLDGFVSDGPYSGGRVSCPWCGVWEAFFSDHLVT